MRTLLALVLAAVALPASAAADVRIPLEPLPETSVGRVAGTRAFVALSLHGDRLRAYVCDGTLRRPHDRHLVPRTLEWRERLRTTWIVLASGHKRGTFVATRPPKCRFVLVTGPNGQ